MLTASYEGTRRYRGTERVWQNRIAGSIPHQGNITTVLVDNKAIEFN